MTPPRAIAPLRSPCAGLSLADGTRWRIAAGDRVAAAVVGRLAEVMELGAPHELSQEILVRAVPGSTSSADELCLPASELAGGLDAQMIYLAWFLSRAALGRGGMLLHGALAEREGSGVILAGPGSVGKSTASRRLPAPWHSLSDDMCMVVRDEEGGYWAHPWPTWSSFLPGGKGGSWPTERALRLAGIFFLCRNQPEGAVRVGAGQSACLLFESAEQAWIVQLPGFARPQPIELRLERFDAVCALAKAVPCHLLSLSLTSPFWLELERALESVGAAP